MNVNTTILEDIGLTHAQIETYLALIELGETTTGAIIQKSKLQNSVIYNALNQLIEKGLVNFIIKGKTKHFSATNPENLIRFLDDKRERLKEILPEIIAKQKEGQEKQEAVVYYGWKGTYTAFNFILETLKEKEDYIGFAAGTGEQYSEQSKRFFEQFQKKRAEKKYRVELIANEEDRESIYKYNYGKNFGKPVYKFVNGYAPKGMIIFSDYTLTVALGENPVAVIIKSKQIAESNKRFFYKMWEMAKP
jgi:HTH-type transcriptional regulator, sugar sensing transcriptional regulator